MAAVDQSPHPVGVYAPSCFIHTEFQFNSPLLTGTSYLQAAAEWWTVVRSKAHTSSPPFLMDSCGVLCNPTCPHHGK